MWCFYSLLPHPKSSVLLGLEQLNLVYIFSTWIGESRTDIICKLLSVLICLEDTWKVNLLISVLHNSEGKWGKWQALLLNTRGLKTQRCPGQDIWVEIRIDYLRLGEKLGWGALEKEEIQKQLHMEGNLESHACPGKMHAPKKTQDDLKLLPGAIP